MNYSVTFIHIMTSAEPSIIQATATYCSSVLTNECKSIFDVYYINYKGYI